MIGSQRRKRHGWVTVITAGLFVFLLLLAVSRAVELRFITLVLLAVGAASLVAHFALYRWNPHPDLEANQKQAQQAAEPGTIPLGPPVASAASSFPAAAFVLSSRLGIAAFALMAFALILIGAPELLRMVNGGAYNKFGYPPVVGPGDTVMIQFSERFASVKGLWKGSPTVTIINDTELGYRGPNFTATTQDDDWGRFIQAKTVEEERTVIPWAKVEIPADPALAGKKVLLRVNLTARYPTVSAGKTFKEVDHKLYYPGELQLGSVKAGTTYPRLWWWGTLAGSMLLLLPGIGMTCLAASLCDKAAPTNVIPCE